MVLDENWQALQLFNKCQRYWVKSVMSTMAGTQVFYEYLDPVGLKLMIETFFSDEDKADLISRFQILEGEAASLLNY